MGWPDYQIWRRRVRRWLNGTDIRPTKRADKILQALDLDLQRQMEDLPDSVLTSWDRAQSTLSRFDALSGERHDDDRRKVGRECLFNSKRKPSESHSQYSVRTQQQFDQLGLQGPPGAAVIR
eukprot:7921170-Pyramimonas_sp.AAC.1